MDGCELLMRKTQQGAIMAAAASINLDGDFSSRSMRPFGGQDEESFLFVFNDSGRCLLCILQRLRQQPAGSGQL
jgi:hypothetical protein